VLKEGYDVEKLNAGFEDLLEDPTSTFCSSTHTRA